ncbi:MAG TPA: PadR family transcriptional regulator [Actinomycetes bacterium]|jgi:DNA-binding PadR family transcriptional regulator
MPVTDLSGLRRFAEPSLFILSSLAGGPKHGYAITKDVGELGGPSLGPGTLYSALARLESLGLIEALPSEARRRPYRLTSAGAELLGGELRRLERLAATGLRRLETA